MKADPKLRRWYAFVKEQPCMACGWRATHDRPVEAAHVTVVVSDKTGALLPRGHTGEAAWGCVPLCKTCHKAQHDFGERQFFLDCLRHPAEVWGTLLLRFFTAEEAPI